jgi:high-affinity K+ transport system ATPase subunit B
MKTPLILLIGGIFFILICVRPQIHSLFISSVIYTLILTVFYWVTVYFAGISEDINNQLVLAVERIFGKQNR